MLNVEVLLLTESWLCILVPSQKKWIKSSQKYISSVLSHICATLLHERQFQDWSYCNFLNWLCVEADSHNDRHNGSKFHHLYYSYKRVYNYNVLYLCYYNCTCFHSFVRRRNCLRVCLISSLLSLFGGGGDKKLWEELMAYFPLMWHGPHRKLRL
jgi:hypothetical protein